MRIVEMAADRGLDRSGLGWLINKNMGLKLLIGRRTRIMVVDFAKVRNQGFEDRSEEHTSELQSLMRSSYAVFCLKKKTVTRCIKEPNSNDASTPQHQNTRYSSDTHSI